MSGRCLCGEVQLYKHTSDSEVSDPIPLLPELQVLLEATKARQKRPSERAELLTR